MWPWEHAAVGYVAYSLALRGLGRRPPTDEGAVALLAGTQLPDLVDKVLSWEFSVFPVGYGAVHSLFVAVPVGALALVAADRSGRRRTGVAFVVGYWSHPVADVLGPLRHGGAPTLAPVLWPLTENAPYEEDYGLARGLVYLDRWAAEVASMDAASVVVLYLLLPLAAAAVWVLDGAPGLAVVRAPLAALRR